MGNTDPEEVANMAWGHRDLCHYSDFNIKLTEVERRMQVNHISIRSQSLV